jgi:LDH2 family malate/lactate/ureidoglycolate dehydrogenase
LPLLPADRLRAVVFEIFETINFSHDEAETITHHLVESNLVGHDTHGVRLLPLYVKMTRNGLIKPNSKISVLKETPSSALLDGNWGSGLVTAKKAMALAIEKAEGYGIGSVGICNCHHIARLGEYTMMAIENDMIGLTVTNSAGIHVSPSGGLSHKFGVCAMSYGIPAQKENAILFDGAVASTSIGTLSIKRLRQEKIPEGWLIDEKGQPTTDLSKGPPPFGKGFVLPLGGFAAGYKGYGLLLLVDIMAGVLTGAGSGCFRKDSLSGQGVFMAAINVNAFMPVDHFKGQIDKMIANIKNSKKALGVKEIRIPGEMCFRNKEKKLKEGIFIDDETWQTIAHTANDIGVDIERTIAHKTSSA